MVICVFKYIIIYIILLLPLRYIYIAFTYNYIYTIHMLHIDTFNNLHNNITVKFIYFFIYKYIIINIEIFIIGQTRIHILFMIPKFIYKFI